MIRAKLLLFGALAALTAATSVLGLIALNGGGEARLGPLTLLRVSAGYDRRAEPLIAPGFMPSPAERERIVRLSDKALEEAPYDSAARLRIAYVDALADGRLSAEGLDALRRSYDLAPVDVANGVWRIGFGLTYALQIPPDLQTQMRNEVAVLIKNPQRRRALKELSHNLPNQVGRFWLALWLRQLEPPPGK